MNKKIKIGLFALIILGTITLCLTYKSNDKIIRTKKRKQNNLAIMIKEDGATDYTKSNSKDIPKGDYVLNRDKSYCKNNGKIGNYDSSLGKISFSFIGSDSCYLYFDYKEDTSLYGTIKKRAKTDTTYLALYTGEGADTYAKPVYYYKGNVQNNNVLFAGFCWKIVRTTETGGVKIVYNGAPKDEVQISPIEQSSYANISNDAAYPYTFDSTSKTWVSTNKTDGKTGTINFTVATAGDYYLSYVMSSEANFDKAKFYKNGNPLGNSNGYSGTVSGQIVLTGLTTSDVIKVEYTKDGSGASGSDTVTFSIVKAIGEPVKSCNNTGTDSQIGTSAFNINSNGNSPAYVGYMYNTVYQISYKEMSSQSNIVFGNSFDYNSNNGTYTLTDTKTVATWSSGYNTINNNHYTCMTTGTTCSSIYYVYYTDSTDAYYITLTGGKSVNDALNEMLYADDVNKYDSTIKNYIDKWYIDNLKTYEKNLEDTVFCNDRRILNLNGWNPNGGDATDYLQFKNYSTSNQSLVCANETDRFSVNNPKAQLNHPIGLLSVPELSLASYRSSHYINDGQTVWLASPAKFDFVSAIVKIVQGTFNVGGSGGVRPSVSLKPNTYFSSGDGSFTNPFVIGDAVEEPSGNSFDTVFAANDTDIFDENGLRYEGVDPKNYICLDNKTSGSCSNNSLLFRIIGLFDEDTSYDGTTSNGSKKLLKVIDTNNYGGTDGKKWNLAGTNNWSTASLKTELNGTYLDALLGTSNVNSKLSSGIANAKWHLGGPSESNKGTLQVESMYTEERNTSAIYSGNPSSIYAKVGLMYPSDYGYATIGGVTTNKSSCRAEALFHWSNSSYSDCKNNDWLYISQVTSWGSNKSEWLISPNSSVTNFATSLHLTGLVNLSNNAILSYDETGTPAVQYSIVDSNQFAVRPTFYLDSSILKIVGTGDGSSSNPYRIG